jgi:hypothetical protein
LIWHNSIATKDNLFRGWRGDTKCRFYDEEEEVHHLFFSCSPAKYMWSGSSDRPENFTQYFDLIAKIALNMTNVHAVGVAALCWAWKLRNRTCFEKKLIKSPLEIICYSCLFLKYWTGLQKDNDKQVMLEGATALQAMSLENHKQAESAESGRKLMLLEAEDKDDSY